VAVKHPITKLGGPSKYFMDEPLIAREVPLSGKIFSSIGLYAEEEIVVGVEELAGEVLEEALADFFVEDGEEEDDGEAGEMEGDGML